MECEKLVPDVDDYDMMMTMMMTMIIRESVVRARDVLEKLRSPKLWLFSKQSSLYCAASAMAAS